MWKVCGKCVERLKKFNTHNSNNAYKRANRAMWKKKQAPDRRIEHVKKIYPHIIHMFST